jgi:CRP-like cAMP-binding protein
LATKTAVLVFHERLSFLGAPKKGRQLPHLEAMIRKLRNNTNLDSDDIEGIRALPFQIKELPANTAIGLEGDKPSQSCLMIEGFSIRSKTTDEGKRQITAIHIAGDIPDLQTLHLHVMDHDFTTLSACTVGFVSHESLRALTRSRPMVAEALWRETLVDGAMFREWIVNVGRRQAGSRLAHLVMEMRQRLAAIGRCGDGHYELPMTQADLGDALGLTPVHVNRVLQTLRAGGMMDIRKNVVTLSDAEKLIEIGNFDELYLHQHPTL